MRTLFWILLLGNVILFAVMQRGGFGRAEQAYQAQPALHPEKIRLLDAPQSAPTRALPDSAPAAAPVGAPVPLAASGPVANSVPAANPVPVVKPVQAANPAVIPAPPSSPPSVVKSAPTATAATTKQNTLICLEWGDFSGADLKRATEVLSALQLGDKLSQRQVEYNKGYWVYIPPLNNKAAANRKVLQLKARGVKEYFILQEAGTLRYAISLGVFKTQDAAQDYLKELRAKGVRSAQVGERTIKLKTTLFMLDKVDALTDAKLNATKKDFVGSELKNVPCALTR